MTFLLRLRRGNASVSSANRVAAKPRRDSRLCACCRVTVTSRHGAVVLDGVDLASLSEKEMQDKRGNDVALIPQDPMSSLNPTTKIGRQIGEGLRIHQARATRRPESAPSKCWRWSTCPGRPSGSTSIPSNSPGVCASASSSPWVSPARPNLLIADEPTTALDVTIQAQILDIMDNLRKELSMAVLLITHDMGVIAGRTDRVVVMYGGKKAEEAPTDELFKSMRHPYTQALLASMPSLETASKQEADVDRRHATGPDQGHRTACRFAPRCATRPISAVPRIRHSPGPHNTSSPAFTPSTAPGHGGRHAGAAKPATLNAYRTGAR
jgi:oligopeptide/dipeptide ABC transporter ATP-binding protein